MEAIDSETDLEDSEDEADSSSEEAKKEKEDSLGTDDDEPTSGLSKPGSRFCNCALM